MALAPSESRTQRCLTTLNTEPVRQRSQMPVLVEHLVRRTGDLQVVRRQHDRHARFVKNRQHRRREVVVDAVDMRHVGREHLQQLRSFFCASTSRRPCRP